MFISRRRFLHACAIAAAVGTSRAAFAQQKAAQRHGKSAPLEPVPYEARLDRVFYLKRASFTPYVDTTFRVRSTSTKDAAALTLVAVADLRGHATKESEDSFSLLFVGARTQALVQDTYLFSHVALGEFTLLLVPVGPRDQEYAYYEVIINRL